MGTLTEPNNPQASNEESNKKKKKKKTKSERKKSKNKSKAVPVTEGLPEHPFEGEDDWDEEEDEDSTTPNFEITSWFNQFYYVSKKNLLLLRRRPFMVTIYLLSSVLSV